MTFEASPYYLFHPLAPERAHLVVPDALVVAVLRERGATVATGRFGADMQVELENDGPVTLLLEA